MIILIAFIKGSVEKLSQSSIILENNDIGYLINVSTTTLSNISLSQKIKVHTYQVVKEDEISLYGFLTFEELNMFTKLISVSGIGPKAALAILSLLSPNEIIIAIASEDVQTLSKAQGIGKKTASRLILELKDKIDNVFVVQKDNQSKVVQGSSAKQDAIEALTALGYSRSESVKIVMEVTVGDMTVEQILKQSLKKLANV